MTTYDAQWLDRMYNNRALVPEHEMHFVRWAEASDDAREAHTNQCDIAYGSSPLEKLDVFPSVKAKSPVVVFIHGGYWRSLDKSQHSFIAPAFKNEGACVFIPNYDLCPAVQISDIVMQMVKALAWIYRNARKFGGDPNRITVVGHSAGGHLATQLLSCAWKAYAKDLPPDLVKGAMSISGLYDMEPLLHTPFLKDSLRLTPEQVALTSPAFFPRPAQGVLYTLVGANESAEFLRHNNLMREAWGRRTVPVCETVSNCNHFSVLEELSGPWTKLHKHAMELMNRS
jgi:arylformamidase